MFFVVEPDASELARLAELAGTGRLRTVITQQARAASAPVPPAGGEATSAPVTMPRWAASLGTAIFALIVQGGGVVLLPYAFTR
jgi:hypothetical protein